MIQPVPILLIRTSPRSTDITEKTLQAMFLPCLAVILMRVLVVQSAPEILPAMMTLLTIYSVSLVAVGAVVLGVIPLNLTLLCCLHSAQDIDGFCGETAHAQNLVIS